MKNLSRLILLAFVLASFVVVFLATPVLAATSGASPDSITVATALVVGWGWIAPLTLYKWIPATDARMKAITIAFTFVVAVVALVLPQLMSGTLNLNLGSPAAIYAYAMLIYGEQQLVWTLLKDHSATAAAVS